MKNGKRIGGINRMKSMTPEERLEFSKKGIAERTNPTMLRATHTGILKIGDLQLDCAVLNDGRRVLSERSIRSIMGTSKPSSLMLKKASDDRLPVFLTANNLKPFITNNELLATALIRFKAKNGSKTNGYECSVLTETCQAYLKARQAKKLTKDQVDIADQCEIIMMGLARTGLVALIDETTGFEEVRDKLALQTILDKYLRIEFAEWAKRFPPSFYEQIFRLNNWKFSEVSVKRPMIIGKYTNDVVYSRLIPELVDELQAKNPRTEAGYRPSKHHQWLSEIGNMDLEKHLSGVTALMKCCHDWKEFKELLDRVYPVKSTKEIFKKE